MKNAPRARKRRLYALLALPLALCFAAAHEARAQSAQGSPPPTYDYDASAPGTQPPTSPLVANHEFRSVRLYQLSIPVLVPLAELQAALPTGFVPVATPANSGTATLTLMFIYQQRFERTVTGQSFGPFSGVLVSTTILNTNVSPRAPGDTLPRLRSLGLDGAAQRLVRPRRRASGERQG